MDAFRLQMVYKLSVGDLQPIGILFISIACFFCNFSYLSSTYTVEKSSISVTVMDNAMYLISNTPLMYTGS